MRDVVVQQPALPGLADDVEALNIAKAFNAKIDDYGQGKLALPRLPSAQERAIMEQRFSVLVRAFKPISYAMTDRERASSAIARLFAGYPSLRNANAAEMVATYVEGLIDLPLFAIEWACEEARKGHIKDVDPDWPPTSPRLYKVAEAYRDKTYSAEYRPMERVLSVKILSKPDQTEAETNRVGEMMRGLADSLTGDETAMERERSEERSRSASVNNERLMRREYAARGIEPVTTKWGSKTIVISPALAEQCKAIPPKPRSSDLHPNDPDHPRNGNR